MLRLDLKPCFPVRGAVVGRGGVLRCGLRQERQREEKEVEYKDSLTDVLFIGMCRKAYGELAGWQSDRDWWDGPETYKGMVEVSRALMKGKNSQEQQRAIFSSFPEIPEWFRSLFPYSKWGAEVNAQLTLLFFAWLVGPMEITETEVDGVLQKSNVHIKKCRYLSESQCVGMCSNLCKAPVQYFFTEQLGMPVTMTPNFEDLSCEMTFGAKPPPLGEDPILEQNCLEQCPTKRMASCWKLK